MRRILFVFIALGVFFIVSVGIHTALITASSGNSTWSDRAASTCAMCHGN